jgi:hypothetical protein
MQSFCVLSVAGQGVVWFRYHRQGGQGNPSARLPPCARTVNAATGAGRGSRRQTWLASAPLARRRCTRCSDTAGLGGCKRTAGRPVSQHAVASNERAAGEALRPVAWILEANTRVRSRTMPGCAGRAQGPRLYEYFQAANPNRVVGSAMGRFRQKQLPRGNRSIRARAPSTRQGIITSVQHLRAFGREIGVWFVEWTYTIDFLATTDQICGEPAPKVHSAVRYGFSMPVDQSISRQRRRNRVCGLEITASAFDGRASLRWSGRGAMPSAAEYGKANGPSSFAAWRWTCWWL